MTCTVIIVNYNGAHFLPDCLDSLEACIGADCNVIVVDNGSTDGSLHLLETGYPWVTVLAMGENLGFAGGNNAGAKASNSEIIVLLNNDTRVAPGWLGNLLKPFSDPSVGAVTSSMRRFGETGIMDSAGGAIDALFYMRDRGRGEPAEAWNRPDELLFPCGGAMAVRRSALEKPDTVFWNDLFMYGEDLDLGLSLWSRGYRVVYRPDAVVEHHLSGTAGRNSLFKYRMASRNRVLALRRHLSHRTKRNLLPLLVFWHVFLFAFLLLRGFPLRFKASLDGTLSGIRVKLPRSGASHGAPTAEEAVLRFIQPTEGTAVRRWFCEQVTTVIARSAGMKGGMDRRGGVSA